jgi:hypothetical protein
VLNSYAQGRRQRVGEEGYTAMPTSTILDENHMKVV